MSDAYVLESGTSYATVDVEGAQVISWVIGSSPLLYTGYSKKRSGIPVLFPYFSYSSKGPQHGFGRTSVWRVVSSSKDAITLELTHEDISDEANTYYPYRFKAVITIRLQDQENGSLMSYELNITNLDTNPLPISPGLHPYWAVMHGNKGEVTTSGLAPFDASALAWDTSPPDTIYPFTGEVAVQFPSKKLRIRDNSPDKNIKYICVWSQPERSQDHNFICFEPVCGDKGEYDSNPIRVQPTQTWQMKVEFIVELAVPASV